MDMKPCPFCGETKNRGLCFENFGSDDGGDMYFVSCSRCGACGPYLKKPFPDNEGVTKEDAVKKWNTRHKFVV